MSSFRSSTDNYSGDTLTNADTSSLSLSSLFTSTSSSAPDQDQDQDQDQYINLTLQIGYDQEPLAPLPIHTLSRPSDWVRLLHSICFAQGQRSILACLSLFYIMARLPLAAGSMYQIYRSAGDSAAEGIIVMVVMFLMWILEREIGLEKRCWDVLVGMERAWIREQRGRKEMEVERLRRWEERQERQRDERWGKDQDEDMCLQHRMKETGTLRDDGIRCFYDRGNGYYEVAV